ncbi:MAG: hypothetical protein R3D67_05790 [Hyphomicrobiaceae bacterium]
MRLAGKLALIASMILWSVPSASALIWDCDVPEIDGPAGLSAIAVVVSLGMIAYDRLKA